MDKKKIKTITFTFSTVSTFVIAAFYDAFVVERQKVWFPLLVLWLVTFVFLVLNRIKISLSQAILMLVAGASFILGYGWFLYKDDDYVLALCFSLFFTFAVGLHTVLESPREKQG